MSSSHPRPRLVGKFIREKRELAGLSQRALGLSFNPPVTTQFISNLERGVTPLPLNHVPTLTRALGIGEAEILTLLEQEYTLKLSGRLASLDIRPFGRGGVEGGGTDHSNPSLGHPGQAPASVLPIRSEDMEFMQGLYQAYRQADSKTRSEFASVCENLLHLASRK